MRARRRSASAALRVAGIGLAAALACLPARAIEEPDRAAAVAAATEQATLWLAALDGGDYAASWNGLAAVMKEGRQQEDFISDVAEPRVGLGKAIMRELQRADFATSVRGAPQGQYVTAIYLTQFSKAPPTLETILLARDGEHWRIAGYEVAAAADAPPATPAGKAGGGAKPGE